MPKHDSITHAGFILPCKILSREIIILPHSQCSLHQCEGRWKAVGSGSFCSYLHRFCNPSALHTPSTAFILGARCSCTHSPSVHAHTPHTLPHARRPPAQEKSTLAMGSAPTFCSTSLIWAVSDRTPAAVQSGGHWLVEGWGQQSGVGEVSILAQCCLDTASSPWLCEHSALDKHPGKDKLWKLPWKTFFFFFFSPNGFPKTLHMFSGLS